MKKLAAILVLMYASGLAWSQSFTTTVISAQKLVDTSKQPLNGTVVVTLTDGSNNPVTYTPQGGSPSAATFTANVRNGQIQPVGGILFAVPAAATTSPAGILYRIQTINSGSIVVWTLPLTPLTVQYSSLDAYIAQAGVPVSGTGIPTIPNCAAGAQYTDTTAPSIPYACSWLPDNTRVWTQNPSQNAMCNQAIAYPFVGSPFCVLSTSAYLLPTYGIVNNGSIPAAPAAGVISGGGSTPGAPPNSVQFNNGGALGGVPFATSTAVTINPVGTSGGTSYAGTPTLTQSGGTCTTAPIIVDFNVAGVLTYQVQNLANCSVPPTVTVGADATGTGATLVLALQGAGLQTAPVTNIPFLNLTSGYGANVLQNNPLLMNPVVAGLTVAPNGTSIYSGLNVTTCKNLWIYYTGASTVIGGPCNSGDNISMMPGTTNSPTVRFEAPQTSNDAETIYAINGDNSIGFNPTFLSNGLAQPMSSGLEWYLLNNGLLFVSGVTPGSLYTVAGTCALSGGLQLSGGTDTCSVSIGTGGGLVVAVTNNGFWSSPPTYTISGASGGSGASLTGKLFINHASTISGSFWQDVTASHAYHWTPLAKGVTGSDWMSLSGTTFLVPAIKPASVSCLHIDSTGSITPTSSDCASGSGGGATLQTNGVNNTSQATLNFVNPATFNGLTFTFSNPTSGNETFALGGTLGNAGLTNSSVTIGSTNVALGATAGTIAGLSLTSPTLTTPALGTPTSAVLTNATGLPLATGVTGNLPNANLAVQTANTVLGALTATTPSGLAVPSCPISALGWVSGTGFVCNALSPSPLVDITNYFPTAVNVGAMMNACHADATVLPGWTCDATRAVQNASAVGTSWAISGGNITISGMQNSVPAAEQVHLVFATTTALNGDYTIGSRTATTVVVPTGSGLTSGTETVTMYPLKNTPDEFARSYNQNEKWPAGLTMYDQTPSTTLATPSAPTVVSTATGGSFPASTNVCATVNYRSGDGVSISSPETCITSTASGVGILTITGPATCPTYAQGYDVNLTLSTVGTLDEKLQGNSACGAALVFTRSVLFPSTTAMPTVATGVPAFIGWNVNNWNMYAESGASGFTVRTGPAFGASNIIATGTKGRSTLANMTFYNYSHINMTGSACIDSAFFVGSIRYNLGCSASGGTSGTPAVAYKEYGTANDVPYFAPHWDCQDTFCTNYEIVQTPATYNDTEGGGQFTLFNPVFTQGGASTSYMITVNGLGFGGNNAVSGAGLSGIHLVGGSMEGGSATLGCAQITDAANVDFAGTRCSTSSSAFTAGAVGLLVTSTATTGGTYTTNTINWTDPHFSNFATPYQNNINGKSITVASNNYPWTGEYHYGGGQNAAITTDNWQSRPVVSDSSMSAAGGFIAPGTTQGTMAFGVGTGAVPTTGLPTNYVGWIGPTSGTPAYFLQMCNTEPTVGQFMTWAAPTVVNGVRQAVCTWTSAGSGTVTGVTATTPITSTGGTAPVIACATCATAAAALTANALLIGGGSQALSALGSLGTTTTVLHGNAAGPPAFGAVVLTSDVSNILPQANGGSGVANTATHTLGTSNQNWATLGTGIVKNTTTTGALSNAASADIIALFSACSGTQYLGADGACHTAGGGGSGTVNSGTVGQMAGYLATGTAVSGVAAFSTDATGAQAQTQNVLVTANGPSSYTTLTAAVATGATSASVVSTTGYPAFGYYWINNTGFTGGDVVSATVLNSTTFTLNSRGLCAASAAASIPIGSKFVPISVLVMNTPTAVCPFAILQNSALLISANSTEWGNGSVFGAGSVLNHGVTTFNGNISLGASVTLVGAANITSALYSTTTNCAAVGTSASPSLVACAAAPAGAFSCATTASAATCVIADTAVGANSEILVQEVADEGTRLGVTCNTAPTVTPAIVLASKTAGVGFTINMPTITTNPACYDFSVVNQ